MNHLIRNFSDPSGRELRALTVDNFRLQKGEGAALIGPSGSGKTTFLHCLSGILAPTEGDILIEGRNISAMTGEEILKWRASFVGYIFQKALLIPWLTVFENIEISADMAGKKKSRSDIEAVLEKVGLGGYGKRMPAKLSGGEQQRAAFVRAVIREPQLILADEPTSGLDYENSGILMNLLLSYQKEKGAMLICATHDPAVQNLFEKKFYLTKGGLPCT